MSLAPRAVIVHRVTEYRELLARHATHGQAEFFLRSRGREIGELAETDALHSRAVQRVSAAVPVAWRRASVERNELSRFAFGPQDVVLAVGQDGLVANVAKYLDGQPVIGIDPHPGHNPGVLVPHRPEDTAALLDAVEHARAQFLDRTMVCVRTDDGQQLTALNELYLGQPGHQSARYQLQVAGSQERQCSSGVIVGTGTGATGWCASIHRAVGSAMVLPGPCERSLAWFVREPWPSAATGTTMTQGRLTGELLRLRVESDALVAFGDGIETDRLTIGWGQQLSVGVAERSLRSVA